MRKGKGVSWVFVRDWKKSGYAFVLELGFSQPDDVGVTRPWLSSDINLGLDLTLRHI